MIENLIYDIIVIIELIYNYFLLLIDLNKVENYFL